MTTLPKYNHLEIEPKWREKWQNANLYKTAEDTKRPKCYVLDMFPYPSGEGLHVGHPKGYIATDIYSRFKKMAGFNVLHPMGWDAFGLPAENYAIQNQVHPETAVTRNIKRFKEQLSLIGFNYDWEREINTTDPKYYRWTQWIFLKLFEKGLAYESHEPINWCPSCKTGLANEDVEDGKCERCSTVVEKKPIRQWVLRITQYAEKMLAGLETLDWPTSIKESQRNWIGRSEGVNIKEKIKDLNIEVEVFDSIPQTFIAQSFCVIAPEHKLVKTLIAGTDHEKPVSEFVQYIEKKKQEKRFDIENDLEGIFTGRYIQNPFGEGDLPIWVASYVLADYGTGMVNCSAHDSRDFAFAKKYNIPLKVAMLPADPVEAEKVKNFEYSYLADDGILQSPPEVKGLRWKESRSAVIELMERKGYATRKVNYKLRDWVFARQRYWGEPIPLIHCAKCGVVGVPESELPVELPRVEAYKPSGTGESPLATIDSWINVSCPKCKGPGKRESNTMPQWAGSSWYHLRYMDPTNSQALVAKEKESYWGPIDFYVGGAEHATRHLIYARFWHQFLYDIGVVSHPEPFKRLQHVGLIGGADGRKMGKRYGNVINPDSVVEEFGADSLRIYEMFMGPFDQNISWSTEKILGCRRFIERSWRLQEKVEAGATDSKETLVLLNQTIQKVSTDIENFAFNTAISALMILNNQLSAEKAISIDTFKKYVLLMAPFAPHVSDEIWQLLGEKELIYTCAWPQVDPAFLQSDSITIVVQINGKVREQLNVSRDISEADAFKLALASEKVQGWVTGKEIKKKIFVPNKLVGLVIA